MNKKVVLVTGGTSGIGEAICKELAKHDMIVYGTGRNPVENPNLGYQLIPMDVTRDKSVHSAVQFIIQKESKIDVLINNAGIGMAGAIEDSEISEILDVFNTNVAGIIRTVKSVLPEMRKQKSGYIINISSVGGLMGLPFRGIYSGSKSSVELISEALSMEVRQFGVKVVLIEPGDFKTSINQNRKVSAQTRNSIYKKDFNRIHQTINQEVEKGEDPVKIGKLIYKIIHKKQPKLRYNCGNFSSRIALPLKRLLPGRIFERIVMRHYDM